VKNNEKFRIVLEEQYKKEPCKVLPNPIWKTINKLKDLHVSCENANGDLDKIEGWDKSKLYIFWNRDRHIDKSFQQIMKNSKFMILHNDYFQEINTSHFNVIDPYFRIQHDNRNIAPYVLHENYHIVESDINKEYEEISCFIRRCYKHLRPDSKTVKSWTRHETFDKELWVWIKDKRNGTPVALGIGEYDRSLREGSLEWIQVLPNYQRRGFGKILVLELLNRLKGRADFTTVSGEMKNETNPEILYRNCGFYGDDVWWLLKEN